MISLFTSHLVVCSLNVLCRALAAPEKGGFAGRASPKHPSEPWTLVVRTDWFISCAQGRDLLEILIRGSQRRNSFPTAGSVENWHGGEHRLVEQPGTLPCCTLTPRTSHQLNGTLPDLLCSNHSRQKNSLAGPGTSSCPAQFGEGICSPSSC